MTKARNHDLEEQIRQNLHTVSNQLTAILVTLELVEVSQANGQAMAKEDFFSLKEGANNMLTALRTAQQSFEVLTWETK